MIATGKLPPDALPLELQGSNDCVLGLEFSGHVQGAGTRVMGILPVKALATRVVTQPEFTWEVSSTFLVLQILLIVNCFSIYYYALISFHRFLYHRFDSVGRDKLHNFVVKFRFMRRLVGGLFTGQ